MPKPPVYRREWTWVAALTAAGAVLRLWMLPRLGLEHFDEGIYAMSGFWILSPHGIGAIDPSVIPYAPPGLPILVGLAYLLTFPWPGVTDTSAIAPSLICGIATIPVSGWLGRRTFGPGAGAAAAAFAALSGPHIVFSRMALTDVPFLLAWLVAFGLGSRFLERPGVGRAVALGLGVGVAQNLKYNGWLVGAIVAAAAMTGLVFERARSLRAIGFGMAAALIAALVYLPWFLFVERHGGYASLLAHHRSYMSGPGSWVANWRQQMGQAVALAGLVSGHLAWPGIAWAAAWVGAALVLGRRANPGWEGMRFRVGLLGGLAALGLLPNLSWWLALGASPFFLRDTRPAIRLLAVWWLCLAVLTPFYYPYARLWLPLTAGGWFVTAGVVTWVKSQPLSSLRAVIRSPAATLVAGCALAGAAIERGAFDPQPRPLPALLAPTDHLRSIGRALNHYLATLPAATRVDALVRPSLTFYLMIGGGMQIRVLPSLAALDQAAYPGAVVLLDEVQLRQERRPDLLRHLRSEDSWVRFSGEDVLGGASLLDVDPAAAYGWSGRSGREPDARRPHVWSMSRETYSLQLKGQP
jgi:4-amino-4-deoxy-L-arabinose transferase-like glycosyltransferase